VALTSCATLGIGNDKTEPDVKVTDTKIITKTETLAGEVVNNKIIPPDSSILEDCGELTDKYIPDGPDIDGPNAVRTAVEWGRTANTCRDKNLVMKGWIQGVISAHGQKTTE